MIKVYQDKFGLNNGNCLAACVASILHKDLANVPNFGKAGSKWAVELDNYLIGYNKEFMFSYIQKNDQLPRIPRGFHIISGMSPRGLLHAVVGFQGRIVHDPHPDQTGLITISDHMLIFDRGAKDEDIWFSYEECKAKGWVQYGEIEY